MKKLLIEIGKVITAIGVIGGSALWFDSKFDNQNDNNDAVLDSIAEVKKLAEFNNIELGFQAEAIQGIQDTLEDFEAEHKKQGAQIKALSWGINHMNQFSPEDFEEIMNEMLKKNELIRWETEWPGSLIPPLPSTELTKVE